MDFAAYQFNLDKKPKGSKITLRASLMQVWKTTKRQPAQLAECPELPEQFEYLWGWFSELFSGSRFTHLELQAWAAMTGNQLKPWETQVLMTLDRTFWKVQHD